MATEDAGIWRVVDLSERARVVTTTLDRHRRRYLELIHERENRVLGGEGG
jgi:hypothetical protein